MPFSRLYAAALMAASLISVRQEPAVAQVARQPARAAAQVQTIPDVVGKTIDSAKAALAFPNLQIVQLDSITTAQPRGRVVAQRPGRGAIVSRTKVETLWVAVPPTIVPPRVPVMPNLFGYTPSAVKAALDSLRLRPGRVFRDSSDQMPAGRVFDQNPKPRTRIRAEQLVDVWYSLGPHIIDTIRVPKIEGHLVDEAGAILRARSLKLGRVDTVYRGGADGTVAHQEPQPMVLAHKNDAVAATVALPPPLIPVPKVVGLSVAAARDTIQARGLDVGVISTVKRPGAKNTIASQHPDPGTPVESHSRVDLVEAQPAPIRRTVVPDLSGKTRAEARRLLRADSLVLGTVRGATADSAAKVDEQNPRKGETVAFYTRVDIHLAAPIKPPEQKIVVVHRVPKLTGRREADARVVAAGDSFTMRVGNQNRRIRLTEVVASQTPGAGEADRGDAGVDVDLDIPIVPPPVVILLGLVGATEETIRRLRRKRIALVDETPAPDPPLLTSAGGDRMIRSTVEIDYDMDAPAWKVQSSSSTLIKSEKVYHG
jgi:beta-lactam-binding protein with PASTA domain